MIKKGKKIYQIEFLTKVMAIAMLVMVLVSCNEEIEKVNTPLFDLMDNEEIGVDFSNTLTYTKEFNVYKYRNFYNGGGVAIGDVNNDGLVDVYLVSNQESNKLYLNKGNMTFEDVTEKSGIGGTKAWSTGVTFVDVNQDNHLDIYVCNSGDINGDNKENELFINNGDMTFTESSQSYNLNDKGYSTHASFFDYDKDGDLDVYILNNSYQAIGSFNLKKNVRGVRDVLGGDKLMRNDGGKFVDVSEEAGIYGSVIGFGLGVTVSDFNDDNWPDIFISNDFFERDYLYLNNHDGTFKEDLTDRVHSISAASMGADAADIDNDGHTDLFVTDMLPYEYDRLKTVTTFDDWDRYNLNLKNGYHRQFTRNMLQRNNGNATFSEISRFAGVDASDWSWGALFFDMDNDGFKDLFIANGIYKDLTNQDYLQYIANETVLESIVKEDGVNYKELIDIIPSNKVENQAYINNGDLTFDADRSTGLWTPSFSNGSAYGDLDNDGDLDLVVNNIGEQAFFYKNNAQNSDNNYLKIVLNKNKPSSSSLGAKITIRSNADGEMLYEYMPTRGFQSTMDPRANIGVGTATTVDVEVVWPSGVVTSLKDVKVNQTLEIEEKGDQKFTTVKGAGNKVFTKTESSFDYTKKENFYVDFNRERLVYHMRSNEGAKAAIGDVNGDGKDDVVFPGAKGIVTEIHIQGKDGSYTIHSSEDLKKVIESEHLNSMLLDVDGDNDLDLYLASGGVEHSQFSSNYKDHLFLNDGKGNFSLATNALPETINQKSVKAIAHADIDGDGDEDIVIGERIKVGKYGLPGSISVLINDGKGVFSENADSYPKLFQNIGMVTDLELVDIDGDKDKDLVVAGEFMPILAFENKEGKFISSDIAFDVPVSGCWNDIAVTDVDGDGDMDIIAANFGTNSRFEASEERPLRLYASDFDGNSFTEGVLTFQAKDGNDYPFALRHNLIDQMKGLKKKFPDYESFKTANVEDILSAEKLKDAVVSTADQMESLVLINDGNLNFKSVNLPPQVQFSNMYSILPHDFDNDGDIDILFGGNQYNAVPEMGIYDATTGVYLEQKDGHFYFNGVNDGFVEEGEIRDFFIIDNTLNVLKSKASIQSYKF